ncbi:MAG: hspA 2 [Planctomycetota bacterium]|nr:hspA 2 [Planctomycetota bacterium]
MAIELWDPFREAVSLRDAMNTLLQESFVRPGNAPAKPNAVPLLIDVSESEDAYTVKASLPGVKPDDVQITVQGDTLMIRAETTAEEEQKGEQWHIRERRVGVFQRSITLPTPVDADKAQAQFDNGVLTLTLPKSDAAKPRQIKVGASSSQPHDGHGNGG